MGVFNIIETDVVVSQITAPENFSVYPYYVMRNFDITIFLAIEKLLLKRRGHNIRSAIRRAKQSRQPVRSVKAVIRVAEHHIISLCHIQKRVARRSRSTVRQYKVAHREGKTVKERLFQWVLVTVRCNYHTDIPRRVNPCLRLNRRKQTPYQFLTFMIMIYQNLKFHHASSVKWAKTSIPHCYQPPSALSHRQIV